MKILWIEDFGGSLNGYLLSLEIFGDFISKSDLDEDEEIDDQLPRAIREKSQHELHLCKSFTVFKNKYLSIVNEFDKIIIDFNLEKFPTHPKDIPKDVKSLRLFDKMAGRYIYQYLIGIGYPNSAMAFFTAEDGTLEGLKEFCRRSPGLEYPQNAFGKNRYAYGRIREWLKS